MSSTETSHININAQSVLRPKNSAMEYVLEQVGKSLARPGHGHRQPEAIRGEGDPIVPASLGRFATKRTLHEEVSDLPIGQGAGDKPNSNRDL